MSSGVYIRGLAEFLGGSGDSTFDDILATTTKQCLAVLLAIL